MNRLWAVRVNEIKLHARIDGVDEQWRKIAYRYSRQHRLEVVYTTRFGRIVDVKCDDVYAADQLYRDLVDEGIPAACLRVVGGKGAVIK